MPRASTATKAPKAPRAAKAPAKRSKPAKPAEPAENKIDRRKHRKPRKLDPVKTLELAESGLSITDIAQHQNVNPSTVWRFLDKNSQEHKALAIFKDKRADFLHHHQMSVSRLKLLIEDGLLSEEGRTVLKAMDPDKKVRIYRDLTVASGIDYDKSRLEEGKTTSNDGHAVDIIVRLEALADDGVEAAGDIIEAIEAAQITE
jgi:hypothetical protein